MNQKGIKFAISLIVLTIVIVLIVGFIMNRNKEEQSSKDGKFVMVIDDVFSAGNRGTMVVGNVNEGSIHPSDSVYVLKQDGTILESNVLGIEKFKLLVEIAQEGDSVGINVGKIDKEKIEKGDKLVSKSSLPETN